jgi:hypothetical protein
VIIIAALFGVLGLASSEAHGLGGSARHCSRCLKNRGPSAPFKRRDGAAAGVASAVTRFSRTALPAERSLTHGRPMPDLEDAVARIYAGEKASLRPIHDQVMRASRSSANSRSRRSKPT